MRSIFALREFGSALILFSCLLPGCGAQIPTLDDLALRPHAEITQTPETLGYPYEEVSLPVADGRSITAWHVLAEQPRGLVLILPGSDACKAHYADALPLLVPNGYECVLVDYEGYGNSPGRKSLANTVDDAYAAASYALALNPRAVIIGASLGTPLAVRVAADFDFAGIILDGTAIMREEASLWLSAQGLSRGIGGIGDLWIQGQLPEAYDILTYIGWVEEPKLFMHSPEDEVTPYAGARRVFDAAPEPKEFWDMRGGHGQMYKLDPEAYAARIGGFIETAIAGRS